MLRVRGGCARVRLFSSLQARDVQGTIQVLRPEYWYVSPAYGLSLDAHANSASNTGGLLSTLHAIGSSSAHPQTRTTQLGKQMRDHESSMNVMPIAALARELLHRNYADETLKCTKNRSLPAYYLGACIPHSCIAQC